jgi:TRAP-type mannitol/chloroaromatic compound transport system substrate-binding protein
MGTGIERFAKNVKTMSGGTLDIKVYPAGALIPALSVFDAASKGQIDAFHSGPYYWKGKNPAFSLFTGFPFGFTPEEHGAWMEHGGGMALWRKLYAEHNLYPMMGGNTGTQMGGWFRKEIKSVSDLKGLKMRIPGLGGEVMSKLGVNPVLMAAGDIYTSLERGTIDATEWIAPAHDIKMGFDKVAPYYYTGWHEPGSMLEITFNKTVWEGLSREHRMIVEIASVEMHAYMMYEFMAENAKALSKINTKKIKIAPLPGQVIEAAKKAFVDVVAEQSAGSKDFAEVWKSCQTFKTGVEAWSRLGVGAFLTARNG